MVSERIVHKELWRSLPNIKKGDVWIHAAQKLGLNVTQPKGGSSHFAIRSSEYDRSDIRSLIVTVCHTTRKDSNEKIFKTMLDHGISEDAIWKALGML